MNSILNIFSSPTFVMRILTEALSTTSKTPLYYSSAYVNEASSSFDFYVAKSVNISMTISGLSAIIIL